MQILPINREVIVVIELSIQVAYGCLSGNNFVEGDVRSEVPHNTIGDKVSTGDA